jgi:osmotically-inducible protein OsmY
MLTSIRPVRLLLACVAPLWFAAACEADDLATRVTSQIQASSELQQLPISVRALGPTVWLSGKASPEQQQAAITIAERTPGVERVVNQLAAAEVRPEARAAAVQPAVSMPRPAATKLVAKQNRPESPAVARPDLASTVASSLRESGKLKGYRVSVKAKDGTVWLSGTLASREQLETTVAVAQATPGVERVVNRLSIDETAAPDAGSKSLFSLPESMRTLVGLTPKADAVENVAAAPGVVQASGSREEGPGLIQLTQAQGRAAAPRPTGRPMPMRNAGRMVRPASYGDAMTLPGPGGQADYSAVEGLADGQMVPGSMRISEGGMAVGDGGMGMGGAPMMGGPMPMGGSGVGMPAVPVRGGGPNMPNYAWPSYSAYPNYAALQYPTQYSPTAWPYIGPFYPYPQVPLGWRRVSLEWDDGWWFLDFDERHVHSHHR